MKREVKGESFQECISLEHSFCAPTMVDGRFLLPCRRCLDDRSGWPLIMALYADKKQPMNTYSTRLASRGERDHSIHPAAGSPSPDQGPSTNRKRISCPCRSDLPCGLGPNFEAEMSLYKSIRRPLLPMLTLLPCVVELLLVSETYILGSMDVGLSQTQ